LGVPAGTPNAPCGHRVLLADDHPSACAGVRDWLHRAGDFIVVAEAGDGETALRLARALQPDLMVLDLVLPGRCGAAVAEELAETQPQLRIVIYTGAAGDAEAAALLQLGVAGYVRKEANWDELVMALRLAATGGRYIQPAVAARLQQRQMVAARLRLTPRELSVLPLVVERLPNREIGQRLRCSEKTAEVHVGSLMAKLDVHSRVDIARRAGELGLLP
jgi:DNA-binding NarL/FixJ family response regulator